MARKPKRVFRGVRRQVLNKLLSAIQLVQNMDFRESVASFEQDRESDYFVETTPIQNALDRVNSQAKDLLALKR